ncbi:glycine zipper domain-containing protein [Asticcacaulis sp.]|uniref:glycine zipper domain-containing protein n=1 Tax=Asticcacaulis sp. TaxID=1872648 RepID=UPI0026302E8E|nr:glycine zipper domain-containing protein [Asticcacaulis sp.]
MTQTHLFGRGRRNIAAFTALFFAAVTVTGCTTSQGSKLAGGTLGGAVVGAGIGSALGGQRGALIGAAVGGLAGLLVTKHLTDMEQKAYEQSLKAKLATAPSSTNSEIDWSNEDGKKTIRTEVGPEKTFAVAAPDFKKAGYELGDSAMGKVPANSSCRVAVAELRVNGEKKLNDPGLWCRNADGDYVRVDGAVA